MAGERVLRPLADLAERTGRATLTGLADLGFAAALLVEGAYWTLVGRRQRQPVRIESVFVQMMEIGVYALPIVTVLSLTIGVMLAIQGIHTLRIFGAEDQVTVGIGLSVVREFAPLITGILVTGRSGSALAARIGTMTINQEIDALTSMAINPVRFLVAPALLAMVIMLPVLTFYADIVATFGGGIYVAVELGMSLPAYTDASLEVLTTDDVFHGLGKSAIFAVLITLVGAVNGASVRGGAEGVGRATTRSVVHGISAIVITDMIFAFIVSR